MGNMVIFIGLEKILDFVEVLTKGGINETYMCIYNICTYIYLGRNVGHKFKYSRRNKKKQWAI